MCVVSLVLQFPDQPKLEVRIALGFGPTSFLHLGGVGGKIEVVGAGKGCNDAFTALEHAKPGEIVVAPVN